MLKQSLSLNGVIMVTIFESDIHRWLLYLRRRRAGRFSRSLWVQLGHDVISGIRCAWATSNVVVANKSAAERCQQTVSSDRSVLRFL